MGAVSFVILLACLGVCVVDAQDAKPTTDQKKVVCYFTNWSHGREEPYNFTPEKVDPFVCTHIIYAFADIGTKNNLIPSDPVYDLENRGYANITALKKKNKNLKVMIGVGGWLGGTKKFAAFTANEASRTEFAQNAVRFIRGYKFDGIDLNWQHPTFREGGTPADRENYVLLAQALKEEFEREAATKNRPRLLLSIAISHNEKFLAAYDISGFNNYMDFISVICYDYHFSYESAVNHHSPLYSLEEDSEYSYDSKANINHTISYFSDFADPDKLVLGTPLYGRAYKLENPEDTEIGSFADGAGGPGPVTKEKGFFAYFEICNFVKNEGWTVVQTKPGRAGPYAYKGDQWVGYDDQEMIRNKATYIKEKGLGGIMFWTIDYDDFLNKCHDTTFPLIRTAKDELITSDGRTILSNEDEDTKDTSPAAPSSPDVLEPQRPSRTPEPSQETPNKPLMTSLPPQPTASGPQSTKPKDARMEVSEVSVPQSNIVGDLIRLIEKAGGLTKLCSKLRDEKARHQSTLVHKRDYNNGESENSIVFETPNMPPILLLLSNSSVIIKEINVIHKSKR